jgi:hypothetical protein
MLPVAFLLFQRPSPPSQDSSGRPYIIGQVQDALQPVAGARVRFQADSLLAFTDGLGRFRLPVEAGTNRRITAARNGYFIAGVDSGTSPLRLDLHRLPHTDFVEYKWVDPRADPSSTHNCANCHAEIFREWAKSGHGHSATGRYFRDLYGSAEPDPQRSTSWNLLAEYPDGSDVCASCHAPAVPRGESPDMNKVRGVAAQGVHCDFCHKIVDAGKGQIGETHGRFGLTLLRPKHGQLFLGPLDDVDRGDDSYSPLYRDSKYCASCHEGVIFGVHVYSTYSEWQESPAARQGKQCQNCHMQPTGRMTNFAPGKGGIERGPDTLANHTFFAGSQEEMLRRSLSVKTTAVRADNHVQVVVTLRTHGIGHRLPTGFIDRHLVLVVEGTDAQGRAVAPVDGPRLPFAAGRDLQGKAGRLYAKLLHYDSSMATALAVTAAPGLFAKIISDAMRFGPAPFWKADPMAEDNRLRPESTDSLSFSFPATVERVRVTLIYRRFWPQTAEAKGWGDTGTVVHEEQVNVERSALGK